MTNKLMTRAHFSGYAIRLMLAAAVTASASCSELARQSKSPTYLIMDSLTDQAGETPVRSDVQSVVGNVPTFTNDLGIATIRAALKNTVNPTAATTVNAITLTRYRVVYKRADGRNTPGVDVPYGFDGAVTRTITAPGTQEVPFDLVRHPNKLEPPLRNLINGGGLVFINAIAEVTFYGHDQAGNEVSISGSIDVHFGDFADD